MTQLPRESDVQRFVREFALADAPEDALRWSAEFTKGYTAAVRDMIGAAGLDQNDMERRSDALTKAKMDRRDSK